MVSLIWPPFSVSWALPLKQAPVGALTTGADGHRPGAVALQDAHQRIPELETVSLDRLLHLINLFRELAALPNAGNTRLHCLRLAQKFGHLSQI